MPEIATEKMTIEFTPQTGQVLGTTDINNPAVTHQSAQKASVENRKVCVQQLVFSFSIAMPCPCTYPAYTFVAGSGTLTAKAQKSKADSLPVLMKDDMGNCSGTWQLSSPPYTPAPCSCQVKISDAGQTKVKGA